jgi:thiamine monophosphate synthase
MNIKKQLEDMVKANTKCMKDLAVACEAIEKICKESGTKLIIDDQGSICLSKKGPDGYQLDVEIDDNG